jgi:hypothetical protein
MASSNSAGRQPPRLSTTLCPDGKPIIPPDVHNKNYICKLLFLYTVKQHTIYSLYGTLLGMLRQSHTNHWRAKPADKFKDIL